MSSSQVKSTLFRPCENFTMLDDFLLEEEPMLEETDDKRLESPIICEVSEESMTMDEEESFGKRSYREFCLGG